MACVLVQMVGVDVAVGEKDPTRRRAIEVPDVNHYTIAFGRRGADAVAAEIVGAMKLAPSPAG